MKGISPSRVYRFMNFLAYSVTTQFMEKPVRKRRAISGFSLLEVLMCLTMLTLMMLPLTIALGSSSQSARGAYVQSTRSILLNSLKNETTPTSPTYVSNFTDSSDVTTVTDNGQAIPYRRIVNTTTSGATNAIKRTTLFYIYTNATDASSAARYRSTLIAYPKVYRMRFGDTPGVIDTLNRYWFSDNAAQLVYDGTNKVPGWTVANWTSNFWGNDILNTTGNDDYIFQAETGGTSVNYSMDVENGSYTVKLYFCETNSNNTGTKRAMNISIEGVQMNTDGPYSPYQSTGGLDYAEVKMYDTTVSDGVLNITIAADSSASDPNANPHAIEVIKRTTL